MRLKLLVVGILLFVLGVSCVRQPTPEEKLFDQVRAYWEAVVAGRWAEAYELEYPPFRKIVSKDVYISRRGNALAKIRDFQIEGLTWQGEDEAEVHLKIGLDLFVPRTAGKAGLTLPVKDLWIRIDHQWYHVPRKAQWSSSIPAGGKK